jgi:hypothetical protein
MKEEPFIKKGVIIIRGQKRGQAPNARPIKNKEV